jgi:epoxide hydrolase-like predicted phosphatase
MIKAITFDLDGVYFINGKENFIKSLVSLGVAEDEARRVFFKSDEMNKKYKRGLIGDEEYWSWAISEWKLNLSVEEIKELLIKGYEVNDRVVEVVKKVREKGFKACICTNNFPARIEGLQKRFGFLKNFDVVVLSYEVKATKPNPKIFEELIKQSEVKPEEIFVTDDGEANIEAAKALGIKAFFYKDFDKFLEELRKLGVEFA